MTTHDLDVKIRGALCALAEGSIDAAACDRRIVDVAESESSTTINALPRPAFDVVARLLPAKLSR